MFLLPGPLGKTFDMVLGEEIDYGKDMLLDKVFNRPPSGYTGETLLGKWLRICRIISAPERWVMRNIVYLLLSFIPFVGPVLVILLRAPRKGFRCHRRYFQLKGYNNAQTYYYWNHHFWEYFVFGVICVSLEQVPYLTYFFAFTNTTGGALWAADIEQRKLIEITTSHTSTQ